MRIPGCIARWSLLGVAIAIAAVGPAQEARAETSERLAKLQAEGPKASLTVFPMVLGDKPMAQVGNVVAVMMEKAGLEEVGVDEAVFRPPEGAGLDEIAAAFGSFVRERGIDRQYALYGEFLGSPQTGVGEIRAVMVDRYGNTVWTDRQARGDAEFDRASPKDPMMCCLFVAERLKGAMALPDLPPDAAGRPGKLQQELARKAGIPEHAELDSMEQRRAKLAERLSAASVVVYPVRVDGETSRPHAERLAAMLVKDGVGRAAVAPAGLPLDVARAMNEQKVLWSLARSFREHVRQHPPEAEYALYADYIMREPDGPVGAVHFVVCDRTGDWVIVDMQNSHHDDFRSLAPESADDCDRLAAKRFASYMR